MRYMGSKSRLAKELIPIIQSYITEDIRLKSIEAIRKPVLQFSKSNVFIREFKSASEAERFLNKNGHHINCCCNGKRKTAYGYKWRYKI